MDDSYDVICCNCEYFAILAYDNMRLACVRLKPYKSTGYSKKGCKFFKPSVNFKGEWQENMFELL